MFQCWGVVMSLGLSDSEDPITDVSEHTSTEVNSQFWNHIQTSSWKQDHKSSHVI